RGGRNDGAGDHFPVGRAALALRLGLLRRQPDVAAQLGHVGLHVFDLFLEGLDLLVFFLILELQAVLLGLHFLDLDVHDRALLGDGHAVLDDVLIVLVQRLIGGAHLLIRRGTGGTSRQNQKQRTSEDFFHIVFNNTLARRAARGRKFSKT